MISKDDIKAIIISLIALPIGWIIEKIYNIFSENWIIAVVAFVLIVTLIFMFITKRICKCTQRVPKIFFIIGMLSIILTIGVITIITSNPPKYTAPPENYTVVPNLIGKEIVPASYEAAYYAGLELDRIRVVGNIINFQDPQEGSLVKKNSSVKVVIGKPTLEIITPGDNTYINSSYIYITGNSFGLASNPNLKIYIVLSDFSIFIVQKVPPPDSTGTWHGKISFKDLQGEKFLIYAIIAINDIPDVPYDSFPNYIIKTGPINIKRYI